MSYAQVCVAPKATTYVQQKVTNKKYTGDLVCNTVEKRNLYENGSSKKPYCAVCFKAGKSLDIYTNHFTKSSLGPNAVVVCPTILAASCSYCKKTGHFKSVCPILKEKERNNQRFTPKPLSQLQILPEGFVEPSLGEAAQKNIKTTKFAALDMDSDDEVDTEILTMNSDVTEDCDTISTNMSYSPAILVKTYASVCEGFAPPPAALQNLDLLSRISIGNPTTNSKAPTTSTIQIGVKRVDPLWSEKRSFSSGSERFIDSTSRIFFAKLENPMSNVANPSQKPSIYIPKNSNKNLVHSWADDDYWSDDE